MEQYPSLDRINTILLPIEDGLDTDPYFPPDDSSLFAVDNKWHDETLDEEVEYKNMLSEAKTQRWKEEIEWRRLSEIFDSDYQVIDENVGAQDVKQGQLGDCYFLAVLASIATNAKEELFDILFTDSREYGLMDFEEKPKIFSIKLLVNGKYEVIMIDDYVPYNIKKEKIAFCSTYTNNIWAILLEKAFAKINGSYEDIIRGTATIAYQFLLPYQVKYFDHYGDSKAEMGKTWKKISSRSSAGKYCKKKVKGSKIKSSKSALVATCATGKNVKKEDRKKECKEAGLNFAHAYCLLDSFIIDKDRFGLEEDHKILKIKNPKISTWKGDWSKDSELWTDEIKEFVGFNKADKGEFYISFNDYCSFFYKTTICFYHPELQFNNIELSHPPGGRCFVRIFLEEEDKVQFKIVQIQRFLFPRTFRYKVSPTHFVIAKIHTDKAEIIDVANSKINQSFAVKPKNAFPPGDYVIMVKLDLAHEEINKFNLNIMAVKPIIFHQLLELEEEEFAGRMIDEAIKKKNKKPKTTPKKTKTGTSSKVVRSGKTKKTKPKTVKKTCKTKNPKNNKSD
ncbi:unnamed protein product [Moneuplotes crassus]|uniref:Calpain catalytic domain-containing protein n=1 Tax=Euplotes crassus TaxID=5936 RepID=A0AAD1YBT5_EUPCR|nr:unnamed protein product [Moneuplotes crassus]